MVARTTAERDSIVPGVTKTYDDGLFQVKLRNGIRQWIPAPQADKTKMQAVDTKGVVPSTANLTTQTYGDEPGQIQTGDDVPVGLAPPYEIYKFVGNAQAHIADLDYWKPLGEPGTVDWQDLTSAQAAIVDGKYRISTAGGAFTQPLQDVIGEWEFANPDFSLGTNSITIGSAAQTFTDASGTQQAGPYIVSQAAAEFSLTSKGDGAFFVHHEPAATLPGLFVPRGVYDAATNTPDVTQPSEQQQSSEHFVYFISTTGTTAAGAGSLAAIGVPDGTELKQGGQLQWWGTQWRYIAPEEVAALGLVTDYTATDGQELIGKLWAGKTLNDRIVELILVEGNEIDLSSLTNQPLTSRKLHIVDNSTTLNLAAGAVGDRAWTWNTDTEQLDFFRHDGTSFIPDAPDHDHEVLENIAVYIFSSGTNAGSQADIEFIDIDGVAYPATDWTVSSGPSGVDSRTGNVIPPFADQVYSGTYVMGHNKNDFIFFKYVGDNANGLSSVNYVGSNGANSDGQIIVNFVGTNYHVDFANKAAVTPTPFTKEAEAEAAAKPWVFSTDNMNAADGDKIILQPNHNINFPGVVDLESVQLAPSTGNWSDIAAGTGEFTPDAAWTFGENQNLLFGSDVITAIANLGSTNWLLLSGGEDAPSQDARFETVALLPPPATVNPGAVAVVYGDPTPANNKPYTARTDGVTQTVAVAWS